MYEIGRVCVKIAGRDSRKKAVIVDVLDDVYVLIDGQVRRKKCNIKHLEPLDKVLKLKKGASNEEVVEALKKEGIETAAKTEKPNKESKEEAKKQAPKEPQKEAKAKKPAAKKPAKKASKE